MLKKKCSDMLKIIYKIKMWITIFSFFRSKTPGGRLVYLYPGKPGKVPRCGDCHLRLRGVSKHT